MRPSQSDGSKGKLLFTRKLRQIFQLRYQASLLDHHLRIEYPHSTAETCEIDSRLPLTDMADDILDETKLQGHNESDSGNAW